MKVLIVEDEAIIRSGIVKKVHWEKFGIYRVLEADNGEEAYDIVVKEDPEIIILDINIPKLNGIELLKRLRHENIQARVIILSGHDNFDYARQAIKYGVDNYLLKPCSTSSIEEILLKVSANISASYEKRKKYEEMKKKLRDMLPFFRTGFINTLITGDIADEHEFINLSEYFGLNLSSEYYIVAVILIESRGEEELSLEEQLINKVELCQMIKEIVYADIALIDSSMSDRILLLMSGEYGDELKRTCFSVVDSIIAEASDKIPVSLDIGIGNVSKGIKNIKDSYSGAMAALEDRFTGEESRVYFVEDVMLYNSSLSRYPYEEEKKLLGYLKTGATVKAADTVDGIVLFLKAQKDRYPGTLIKAHLKQLVYYMVQLVYEFGGDISDLYSSTNVLGQVENFYHIDQYQKFLRGFAEKLCEYILNKRYLKHTSTVRKIIAFIEDNYSDEGLNLEKIADYAGMHPNYVSHLFKKEKGESLTSYICRYRVKIAEGLILKADQFKVYDIAYEVGFNDAHYFTTCFKNIVGITPSEYRNLR